MKQKVIIYMILCVCIISCRPASKQVARIDQAIDRIKPNKELYSIEVDKALNQKEIFLSKVFNQVKTIILETNKDALIGSISSMQIYKDSIFILDRNGSKGLFLFNKEGRFLKRYGNIGRGPGEYSEPSDFTLNIKNKIVYILDSQTQNILMYNLTTGDFIRNIHMADSKYKSFNIQCADNCIFTDAYYYAKQESAFLLQEINTATGERTKKWLPTKLYNKSFSMPTFANENVFFDRTQKSPKFTQYFMDTIISIGSNEIMPFLAINSPNLLKENDLKESGVDNATIVMNLLQKNLIYHISDFVSYKDIVYFTFRQKNFFRCCLYNTKTKETQIGINIIDDLIYQTDAKNISLIPRFCTSSDDGMYAYIDPIEMDKFIELAKKNRLQVKLDKLIKLKQLKHESNPIIFIYN